MGTVRTDEFRKDAVRIALTSGLSRRQVADDLGVGLSTLNKWVNAHRDTDVVSAEDRELARGERTASARDPHSQGGEGHPKKSHSVLREPKAVRFRFVEEQRGTFPVDRRVPRDECQPARLACLSQPSRQPQAAHGYGGSGAHPGAIAVEPGQLWPPEA